MYYYAMIDDSNIVTNTLSAGSPISAPTMIPITEEQFNSGNLVGKYYDSSTGDFVDPTPSVLAAHSTAEINHGEEWLSDIIDRLYVTVPKKHETFTSVTNHGIIESIRDIAYGNGIYVFVGDGGSIYTSTDLVSFTKRTSGTSIDLQKILFHNGMFVVISSKYAESGVVLKSTNGIDWSIHTTTFSGAPIDDIACGEGVFIILSDCSLYKSTDGLNWTKVFNKDSDEIYNCVCYGQGKFIAVGYEGNMRYTVDNTFETWYMKGITSDITFYKVAYNPKYDNFVAASGRSIYTSIDGLYWKETETEWNYLHNISSHNGVNYVIGEEGVLIESINGHDWHTRIVPSKEYVEIAKVVNDRFITISGNNIMTIDDATETVFITDAL